MDYKDTKNHLRFFFFFSPCPFRPPGKVLKPEDFEEMERQSRGRGGGRGGRGGRGGFGSRGGWRPQLGFTPSSGYRDNKSADAANRMIRLVMLEA